MLHAHALHSCFLNSIYMMRFFINLLISMLFFIGIVQFFNLTNKCLIRSFMIILDVYDTINKIFKYLLTISPHF